MNAEGSGWIALAVLLLVVNGALHAQSTEAEGSDAWVALYEPQPSDGIPYRLMKPLGFAPERLYPVIVSLHGGGGRGTDNRKQLRVWNRLLADRTLRSEYPSYVLAPQSTELWDVEHLGHIKRIVSSLPSADMDRIYLLGHSMGGHGSFILLQIDPGYFAAAAPSAGTGRGVDDEFIDPSAIKDIPIWAFHGDKDKVCPYERAERLFGEMARLGGNFKLTTWEGDGHGVAAKMITGSSNGVTRCSSSRCDDEPAMLEWLFSHSLSSRD